MAVQLSPFQFVQQAVQFAQVSFFLTHQRPADALPLQLLRLIAGEPCAQQVSQRRQVAERLAWRDNGLPDLLIQADDPLRLQRDVQQAVLGVGPVRRRGNVPRALFRHGALIDLHPDRNPDIVAGLKPDGGSSGRHVTCPAARHSCRLDARRWPVHRGVTALLQHPPLQR
ncbi:hypothetical protein [Klebsiella michiganensis]|uniref:hypothetical protein n=1 Tax=Klebsiella michiganensis TaxID=1134687 RepID=UPI001D0D6859|nr:hypothetical protein [Klebsiella michiganensis]